MTKKNKKKKAKKSPYTKLTPKIKEDVRALAKKKFIRLKIKEIGITLSSILGIIFLPYWVGLWFHIRYDFETFCEGICISGDIWIIGLLVIVFIAFCLLIIYGICRFIWYIISEILKSNWSKAYDKAERELGIKSNKSWYYNDWWKRYYKKDKKDKDKK